MSALYVLIPISPLLATIIIALAGSWLREASGKVGAAAIGLSFGLSVAAFVQLILSDVPIVISFNEAWLRSGDVVINFGLYLDQLTVLVLLLVTGVSFVVHVYSSRYMTGDARYTRFFAVMGLFTFAMVTLVMSSNLLMVFMCWEIMGICSYLLISHQAERPAACRAATKAFLVNAVADVGLLLGVLLVFATFDTLDIPTIRQTIFDQPESVSGKTINLLGWAGIDWHVRTVTLIALLLFMGCLGKSAQVPFHVWLPHAMEAPTPVSALIHAATMVNAGPFLLVRFSPLLLLSPPAMTVIAIVGGTTALFAAVVSLTQSDIKKILAYSTISQIGFMIMACGVGAFVAAVFHLLAHGFLKGFLFLSTGSQLEAVAAHGHDEAAPGRARTPWSAYCGALALACVPPVLLFSGFYERLWTTHDANAARITFWVIGLLTVFFTAMYLARGVASLFQRDPAAAVQPRFFSPSHLLGVAAGTIVLIGVLVAIWSWFASFLTPALGVAATATLAAPEPGSLLLWLALPLLAALGGWAIALLLHATPKQLSLAHSGWGKTLYVLFLNKGYCDEIYSVCIVRPTVGFSRWLWQVVDVRGIDRVVFETGYKTVSLAKWLWRCIDVRVVDRPVERTGSLSVGFARWLWQMIDVRVVDRSVEKTGSRSVALARWLWRVIDVRRIDKSAEQIGRATDATGHKLQDVEPRTLQHHLLVLIFWLVVAIVFFYSLVLGL